MRTSDARPYDFPCHSEERSDVGISMWKGFEIATGASALAMTEEERYQEGM